MIIGIDLGVCSSYAAIMCGPIPVISYDFDTGDSGIPTEFMYDQKADAELFGEECETPDAWRHPEDVICFMDRIIRRDVHDIDSTVISGGCEFSYAYIIEKFLAYLIDELKRRAKESGEFPNTEIEAITVTVPLCILKDQTTVPGYRRSITDALKRITDLPECRIRVIQEPVAAAISYLFEGRTCECIKDKHTILIFDLGGRTSDATVIEFDPHGRTLRIISENYDPEFGGNAWDRVLADEVMRRADIREMQDTIEKSEFMKGIVSMKEHLSYTDESGIFFRCNGRLRMESMTRDYFEEMTYGLSDRAMHMARMAMIKADIASDETGSPEDGGICLFKAAMEKIDRFVLVGGGCNMPMIKKGFIEKLHIDESRIEMRIPEHAPVKGAALYSKIDSNCYDIHIEKPLMTDVTTCSYGIRNVFAGDRIPVFHELIRRGSPFYGSISVTDSGYGPVYDAQECVEFELYVSDRNYDERHTDPDAAGNHPEDILRVKVPVPDTYRGHATDLSFSVQLTLYDSGMLKIRVFDELWRELDFSMSAGEQTVQDM